MILHYNVKNYSYIIYETIQYTIIFYMNIYNVREILTLYTKQVQDIIHKHIYK